VIGTLKFILNHPLNENHKFSAVKRFLWWQIKTRFVDKPYIHQFTPNSKLLVRRGMTGATGNIYCGLHEFNDMGFLLHFLRNDDLFIDIGANIGSYTILASSEIGAQTISIEPIPSTIEHLKNNVSINSIEDKVEIHNIGLGAKEGFLEFTKSLDTVNHVASPGEVDTLKVPIKTLNQICENKSPILIKIDVEGFETEVINGANEVLSKPTLQAIIIELNGSGKRYGYNEELIHIKLMNLGFKPINYNPIKREIHLLERYGDLNTVYIRDVNFVENRITKTKHIKVVNNQF